MRSRRPLERYEADLAQPGFLPDPAQRHAVECLDAIHGELSSGPARQGLVGRFLRTTPWQPVAGAYLWGGVGRGKTYLMDCFYETLPLKEKRRVHFHRFMQSTHAAIRAQRETSDPLAHIAADLAAEVRVLCFDEFFVADVADAMILGRLLEQLFARGMTLVATSNIPPDALYAGGLQRDRFLPAIERIKAHCRVVEVNGETDYRLRLLEQAELYHSPLDAAADHQLDQYFREIAPDAAHAEHTVEINEREIPVRKVADGIAWFEFDALCCGPRAATDYIELARLFGTVLVSNLPQLTGDDENAARRFLHLVDEFYDRRVKLILSAAVPMEELYVGYKLRFEYERVLSRLQEMQSHHYLAAPHRP